MRRGFLPPAKIKALDKASRYYAGHEAHFINNHTKLPPPHSPDTDAFADCVTPRYTGLDRLRVFATLTLTTKLQVH